MEEVTKGSIILHLVFTKREELIKDIQTLGSLAKKNYSLMFAMRRKGNAEGRMMCILDFKKADFNKPKEILGGNPIEKYIEI